MRSRGTSSSHVPSEVWAVCAREGACVCMYACALCTCVHCACACRCMCTLCMCVCARVCMCTCTRCLGPGMVQHAASRSNSGIICGEARLHIVWIRFSPATSPWATGSQTHTEVPTGQEQNPPEDPVTAEDRHAAGRRGAGSYRPTVLSRLTASWWQWPWPGPRPDRPRNSPATVSPGGCGHCQPTQMDRMTSHRIHSDDRACTSRRGQPLWALASHGKDVRPSHLDTAGRADTLSF